MLLLLFCGTGIRYQAPGIRWNRQVCFCSRDLHPVCPCVICCILVVACIWCYFVCWVRYCYLVNTGMCSGDALVMGIEGLNCIPYPSPNESNRSTLPYSIVIFFLFSFFILRRMGKKNKLWWIVGECMLFGSVVGSD